MSSTLSEDRLIEAVRASSPTTRARLLRELLADHVRRGAAPDRPPPRLSPAREAELNDRLRHLDDSRPLADYLAKLTGDGGSS